MTTPTRNPLAPKPPHHPAKAKSCIFLFMEGGVSQMDTFEYKPALVKYAGKQMPKAERTEGELATFSAAPNRIIPPYWGFKQHGQSGRWMSDLLPDLGYVRRRSGVHPRRQGRQQQSWPGGLSHAHRQSVPGLGLGRRLGHVRARQREQAICPAFIVMGDRRGATIGGAGVWGNGFLPAAYQGTLFRNGDDTDRRSEPPARRSRKPSSAANSICCAGCNEKHSAERTEHTASWMRASPRSSWRSACRRGRRNWWICQASRTRRRSSTAWMIPSTEPFGRQCLLARRMVERGVRFVKLLHGAGGDRWDDHGAIKDRLPVHCQEVDRPVAGLLKDLKSRGLLDQHAGRLGVGDGPHAVRQQSDHRQARPRPQPVRAGRLDGRRRRQAGIHVRRDG